MKNKMIMIAVLALALTGCASAGTTPEQDGGAAAPTTETAGTAAVAPQPSGTDPSGAKPDMNQGKRVRGQIQDILGNEVTLALAEEPKRPEGAADGNAEKPKTATATGGGDPMGPPGGMSRASAVKLTGETLGIQIPVGVPIVSRTQGGETTLQLSELVVGDILTVLYDTDGSTIIKVNVISGGTQ